MPHTLHPEFRTSRIADTSLWRYMDFSKFVRLIQSSTLFFPSVGTLAASDRYEGLHTLADREFLSQSFARLTESERRAFGTDDAWTKSAQMKLHLIDALDKHMRNLAVSCWHAGDHESVAMWKIYGKDEYGVCIQSGLHRMTTSFERSEDEIFIGQVEYLDYARDRIDVENGLAPILRKRREFSYENEVRAVIWRRPKKEAEQVDIGAGIAVPVSLNDLIDTVHVSPFAVGYMDELLADILSKYGLSVRVVRSKI